MFKINPLYYSDGYKVGHKAMLAPGTQYLYGTWIPRSTKHAPGGIKKIVSFGQQLVWKFINDAFNENFFDQPESEAEVFAKDMCMYLGMEYKADHFKALHQLGYLPIEAKALPEGVETDPNIPHMTFVNTVPGFAWLTLYLETPISSLAWKPSTSATIALQYRRNVTEWLMKTDPDNAFLIPFLAHDFSARGLSPWDMISSGLGHATSFRGSDTLAVIPAARYYYNEPATEVAINSVNACFPDGAEILTDRGFIDFRDLSYDDKVAQYSEGGAIEFVYPEEIHIYDFDGELLSLKSGNEGQVDFLVTDNHRFPYIAGNGNFCIKEAKDLPIHPVFKIAGESTFEGPGLSEYERLLIAFQADGSYSTRDQQYTGLRKGTIPMRFPTIKKERKIERLEAVLEAADFTYTKSEYPKGPSYRVEVPFNVELSKTFDWVDLTRISKQWCIEFIEELQYWDGSHSRKDIITYSSILKENVDVIQAIAALGGIKTHYRRYDDPRVNRQPIHNLTITFNKEEYHLRQPLQKTPVPYKGKVRCVTVPSGMFVARQNDRVIISGNSEHSVSTTKIFTVGEKQMLSDWLKLFPTGILSVVADTFDLWKLITEYLPELKEEILDRDGKIVIRPDSGNPVDIICGVDPNNVEGAEEYEMIHNPQPFHKGVIELLWDIFGGTINAQGYKVLDPHIGAIYGDSINLDRQIQIYQRLEAKGFAATNIVLGVGSFTYQMNTRDTFGFAAKGGWFQVLNEDGSTSDHDIYKDPVTDDGTKKSPKGLLQVQEVLKEVNSDGGLKHSHYVLKDQCTWEEEKQGALKTIFKDGKLVSETTLADIRQRLNRL